MVIEGYSLYNVNTPKCSTCFPIHVLSSSSVYFLLIAYLLEIAITVDHVHKSQHGLIDSDGDSILYVADLTVLVHAANAEKENRLQFEEKNQHMPNLGSHQNELPELTD